VSQDTVRERARAPDVELDFRCEGGFTRLTAPAYGIPSPILRVRYLEETGQFVFLD
jgi:hypothetical protein